MSYQIKQTPFFQRMLSTSKKNGQLAKLKEEYERIKDFNDRTIDMKMRQVRLKRLFREIEEIKDSSVSISQSTQTKRRRLGNRSAEAMRMEAFVRAKELGKEYSKLNAHMERSYARAEMQQLPHTTSPTKLENERRARSNKRINYGNEISRYNVEKIALHPRNKNTLKRDLFNVSSIDVQKKEKLMQRLNYGNSRSSLNMSKIPKRHTRHKIATEAPSAKHSDVNMMAEDNNNNSNSSEREREREREQKVTRFDVTSKDTQILQTFEELKNTKIRVMVASELEKDAAEQRLRARQRWHKISLTIRHRFDTPRLRRFQQALHMCDEHEHILRMISNEMHLPQSRLNEARSEAATTQPDGLVTDTDEADDFDDANDEMLYSVETLSVGDESFTKPPSSKQQKPNAPTAPNSRLGKTSRIRQQYEMYEQEYEQEYELLPPPSPSLLINEGDEGETTNSRNASAPVDKFGQMFQPEAPEPAPKEPKEMEFSVQKLRNIFEHQSDL